MNVKNLLIKTDCVIAELDPYLIKILKLIKNNQLGSQKIRKSSSTFIEFNDFCFDSEVLLKSLFNIRDALDKATESAKNQISFYLSKKEKFEHKYNLYKGLEYLLQKTSNPTKIRYAMYTAYGESWEDFIELSTLEILDEMDYGKSVSSTLYRNVEQILDSFNSESSPISKVDKNIKFYTLLRDGIPLYTEEINNRIKILCYLKKIVA